MKCDLPSSLLLLSTITHSVFANNVTTWPNAFPKQLATSRRRPGITQAEYLYHHSIVHGHKAWNAPDTVDQPWAYVQDHIFDSAYGINTTSDAASPTYIGHQDITELYSRSENAFRTPPSNNYTATVIGPDGAAFNDFNSTFSLYAYERFSNVNDSCAVVGGTGVAQAFFWLMATSPDRGSVAFDNATFAAPVLETLLENLPAGSVYNVSTHLPVADLDSRPYYGGLNNPTVNAVLKFWLCDDNLAVLALRRAQLALQEGNFGVDLSASFVQFTRPVLIYDRGANRGFSEERARAALMKDAIRGDVVLEGSQLPAEEEA